MANLLETNKGMLVQTAAGVLADNCVVYALMRNGYVEESDFKNGKGGEVKIRIPAIIGARQHDPVGGFVPGDVNERSVPVTVELFETDLITLGTRELNFDLRDWTQQILEPALSSLADTINRYLLAQAYVGQYNWVGTPGTDPTVVGDFTAPWVVLQRNQSKKRNRRGLLGGNEAHALTNTLSKANEAGGDRELREGIAPEGFVTRTAGIDFYTDQAVDYNTHQVGTYDNGAVVTNGALLATDTTLVMAGGVADGTVNAGDLLTFADVKNADGSLKQFVVTVGGVAVAGAISVTISPAPGVAVPDATAVTFAGTAGESYRKNMVFDTGYAASVIMPISGMDDQFETTFADPRKGYGLTMMTFAPENKYGNRQVIFRCGVAFKVVREQHGCLLLS